MAACTLSLLIGLYFGIKSSETKVLLAEINGRFEGACDQLKKEKVNGTMGICLGSIGPGHVDLVLLVPEVEVRETEKGKTK